MYPSNTTEVQVPAQTTDEQSVVDPRIAFAHALVREASDKFLRNDAVRVIQAVMPEYVPEHEATGPARKYAEEAVDTEHREIAVTAFQAGYDAGRYGVGRHGAARY